MGAPLTRTSHQGGKGGALQAAEKPFQAVIASEDFMILRLTIVHENGDPLTRPTTADENAVVGHPLPQGGEGRFSIFVYSGEPKDHDVFARNDRVFSKQMATNA
jgi:hypothetical protein